MLYAISVHRSVKRPVASLGSSDSCARVRQGSRNNVDDFESQGVIRRVDEKRGFRLHTIYGAVVDLVRPSDVRWQPTC